MVAIGRTEKYLLCAAESIRRYALSTFSLVVCHKVCSKVAFHVNCLAVSSTLQSRWHKKLTLQQAGISFGPLIFYIQYLAKLLNDMYIPCGCCLSRYNMRNTLKEESVASKIGDEDKAKIEKAVQVIGHTMAVLRLLMPPLQW